MEIPRGGRVSKAIFFLMKGNFRRGGGSNLKNLPWEGYGYFLEQHILQQKEMRTFTNKNLSLII